MAGKAADVSEEVDRTAHLPASAVLWIADYVVLDRIELFLTRSRRVHIGSPSNEDIGRALQHRFTSLIAQEHSGSNDPPVGFGFRLTHLQDRSFEIERIARAYRVRQPQPNSIRQGHGVVAEAGSSTQ